MNNTPVMKIGIVAVSRDCFPESLSVTRRQNLVKAYEAKYGKGDIYECPVCIVESDDTGFAWNKILALSLISILPQLIVFFCAQDQFVEGISAGAVKG